MKLHVSLHKIHHIVDNTWSAEVEIYTQPTWRRIVARIYHWYDMRIFKVPGFKLLEDWYESKHDDDSGLYIPLSAQQDLRCYDLTQAERKTIVRLKITEEQYKTIQAARRRTDPGDSV